MGLFDKLRGEFIDIIEWTQPSDSEVLAYRFPRYDNEIKMGAKLTVREGQAACFVNEGQLADVYAPGMYTLETQNMPILSTLKGWKYGFHSPFKAEVYFISTKRWTDQKWGTQNPIMLRDPEFGPVRVRAFGTYAIQVNDPATFLRQLVATDPSFETYEITAQLRNTIVARFTDALGRAKVAVLDLAGNYDRIAKVALEGIAPDLAQMGLALPAFYIENVSLPPEVEQALDTRTKMGVLGDLNQYTKFQAANAIPEAAANPGGMGGVARTARRWSGHRWTDGQRSRRWHVGPADPAAVAGHDDVLRRHQRPAGRPVRPARAGSQGPRRDRHARQPGVEAGHGKLDRRRIGARTGRHLRRGAAAAAAELIARK